MICWSAGRGRSREASAVIQVRNLTKSFGTRKALVGVNLDIAAGEFVALVGPNGAGKTTLLRILATLSRPTAGSVRIAGLDSMKAGEQVRRRIGFLSHRTLLYDDLTAVQNLRFYARMYDLPAADDRIAALLAQVGLTGRRDDLVRTFSRGMQQRLAVVRAVLHRPAVLLLDEPFTGLDPNAAQSLTALLTALADEGGTVLFSTHNLERGLALGQRVVVLRRGRVVYDEPRSAIAPESFGDVYRSLTA